MLCFSPTSMLKVSPLMLDIQFIWTTYWSNNIEITTGNGSKNYSSVCEFI